MTLNAGAQSTIRLLQTGEGFPLSPENIGVTKSAFPLIIDSILQVTMNGEGTGLMAFGLLDGRACMVWVSEKDPDGWQLFGQPKAPPMPSRWDMFRRHLYATWRVFMGAR